MNKEKTIQQIEIKKIIRIDDLYPRVDGIDQQQVNLYRQQDLDKFNPIALTKIDKQLRKSYNIDEKKEYILTEGAHRLEAYFIEGKERIPAIVKEKMDDFDIFIFGITSNKKHGLQLSLKDKKEDARILYTRWPNRINIDGIAKELGVSIRVVQKWTKDLREKHKEERNDKIIDLYLVCKTQAKIAKVLDISVGTVNQFIKEFKKRIVDENESPDSLQIYNNWPVFKLNPQFGSNGYPGQIPGAIIENFLYYYTEPFDIVIDPMAGGGTTGDVAKVMYRRCRMYDLHPAPNRPDIQSNDISNGYPDEVKSCDAIFLDPPYWHMKDKQYKEGTSSSLSRQEFLNFIKKLAEDCYIVLKDGGVVGFLFQDTMPSFKGLYHLPENETEPIFAADLFKLFIEAGFKREFHFQAPLSTQQYTGTSVNISKEARVPLHVVRDFYVFRKMVKKKR